MRRVVATWLGLVALALGRFAASLFDLGGFGAVVAAGFALAKIALIAVVFMRIAQARAAALLAVGTAAALALALGGAVAIERGARRADQSEVAR